jgi:hypothetical protein
MLMNLTALIMWMGSAPRVFGSSPSNAHNESPALLALQGAQPPLWHPLPQLPLETPAPPMPILLDDYVIETLMPDLVGHDHHPSAFLVYLALWRLTGGGAHEAVASLRQLAEDTGLSRRAVQDAVSRLATRRLATVERAGITDVPTYRLLRPWAR